MTFNTTCAVHVDDCEGWWLSGYRGSVAEHWRIKPEMSWVWLPATTGFFTFLYFCHINFQCEARCSGLFCSLVSSLPTVQCCMIHFEPRTLKTFLFWWWRRQFNHFCPLSCTSTLWSMCPTVNLSNKDGLCIYCNDNCGDIFAHVCTSVVVCWVREHQHLWHIMFIMWKYSAHTNLWS